jgi:hypothetical protein
MKQDTADPMPDVSRSSSAVAFSRAAPVSTPPPVKKGAAANSLPPPHSRSSCAPKSKRIAARPHSHLHRRPAFPPPSSSPRDSGGLCRTPPACARECCPFPVTGRVAAMAAPRTPDHAIKLFGRTIALPNSTGAAAAEVRTPPQPFRNHHCPRVLGEGALPAAGSGGKAGSDAPFFFF